MGHKESRLLHAFLQLVAVGKNPGRALVAGSAKRHGFFPFPRMDEKNYTGVIPEQQSGVPIDTESSVELETTEAAKRLFQTARRRLLHVNDWHELAGTLTADFQLVDERGADSEGAARQGFYFKVDIPGPGPAAGGGYDWVRIEAVEEMANEEVESVGIRVRPTSPPGGSSGEVAHFYSPDSTSSFTVTREGRAVTAAIYDRNTKPNSEAHGLRDKIRDAVVGAGGVIAGSRLQWKALANALIQEEK